MMRALAWILLVAACGGDGSGRLADAPTGSSDAKQPDSSLADASIDAIADATVLPDSRFECAITAPTDPIVIAPPFDTLYRVADLGPVPGVPDRLGGMTVSSADPNTLLVAGASESGTGAIYSIGVTRDVCGHINGFVGTAVQVTTAPNVDANLVYLKPDLLAYTAYPIHTIGQVKTGSTMPDRTTDLQTIGHVAGDGSIGGFGIVPPDVTGAAGGFRALTWPNGTWLHLGATEDPMTGLFDFTAVTKPGAILANGPGGFAYVPSGSPGFTTQSLIVAEWSAGKVAVYDVDAMGDPVVATRRDILSSFPSPWGAYFEPATGDYYFLSWGRAGGDRVFVIQGFNTTTPL